MYVVGRSERAREKTYQNMAKTYELSTVLVKRIKCTHSERVFRLRLRSEHKIFLHAIQKKLNVYLVYFCPLVHTVTGFIAEENFADGIFADNKKFIVLNFLVFPFTNSKCECHLELYCRECYVKRKTNYIWCRSGEKRNFEL